MISYDIFHINNFIALSLRFLSKKYHDCISSISIPKSANEGALLELALHVNPA